MSKTTASGIEKTLLPKLNGFKESAAQVKAAHAEARQAIKDDPRRSDAAKKDDLAALSKDTRAKLDSIKADQESYVKGLRSQLEKEFRGNRSSDPASVVSRRDAADRARKIIDQKEAVDILNDAIANGDADMAHAIGNRGRNNGWGGVVETWRAAYPDTAGAAEALDYVEANTSGGAYNLSNSITFSAPTD